MEKNAIKSIYIYKCVYVCVCITESICYMQKLNDIVNQLCDDKFFLIKGLQSFWEEREINRWSREDFQVNETTLNDSVMIYIIIDFSKSIECVIPRMHYNVKYGFLMKNILFSIIFYFFLKNKVLCQFLLYSTVTQSYMHIHSFSHTIFHHILSQEIAYPL